MGEIGRRRATRTNGFGELNDFAFGAEKTVGVDGADCRD